MIFLKIHYIAKCKNLILRIMNILIINWQDIKNPFGGGAEVHLHEIFKRIVKMGHNVTLLSCEIDNEPLEEIIDGIRVIRKGKRNIFNFYVKGLYKEISSKEKFDIVIDDINKIPFYTPLFVKEPILAISHHFFGKSIFKEAGLLQGLYVYLAEWLMNFIYKKSKFVVVSNSTLDEFLDKGFDKKNFSIVYNAVDDSLLPMQVSDKFPDPVITYFGRLKKYKSVDHLLKAFAMVKKEIPNAKLWLMGRGDFQPYLENLANELGIIDSTKFFGFVSEEDKIKYLSLSHIAVNTSIKEGWGITNIEANACGTLVISSNSPGLRDSVNIGQSGLIYEYGNIEDLSSKIIDLLKNRSEFENLSHGAVDWAKLFTWNKSAEEMLKVINKLIKK
jgi:glycosyltransferase involved in cell wall biosynthesis